jgi:hypothetical protein
VGFTHNLHKQILMREGLIQSRIAQGSTRRLKRIVKQNGVAWLQKAALSVVFNSRDRNFPSENR